MHVPICAICTDLLEDQPPLAALVCGEQLLQRVLSFHLSSLTILPPLLCCRSGHLFHVRCVRPAMKKRPTCATWYVVLLLRRDRLFCLGADLGSSFYFSSCSPVTPLTIRLSRLYTSTQSLVLPQRSRLVYRNVWTSSLVNANSRKVSTSRIAFFNATSSTRVCASSPRSLCQSNMRYGKKEEGI